MKRLYEGAQKLGIELEQEQLQKFDTYYSELVAWNRKMNLTRITDYEEVQVKHFLDALTLLAVIKTTGGGLNVIDIGTGAGLPGIPLKIVRPEIRLMLLEATVKKAQFLYHLSDKLGLQGATIITGRAEEKAHEEQYRENFDIVVSRAVAALPTLVELTLPFCNPGGIFIAQKKGAIEGELNRASRAIDIMGGRPREIIEVDIGELQEKRKLVIIDKVSRTPAEYPRRPGMASKRPILSPKD